MLTAYVLIVCGLTLLFTASLYPVTTVLGRTTLRAFARAVPALGPSSGTAEGAA